MYVPLGQIRFNQESVMTVEPFKRITEVTQDIANNWQKYYVCMERLNQPASRTYEENAKFYDKVNLWRQLISSPDRVFTRPLAPEADDYYLASVYESGWVVIDRKDSVEFGVLVDHNKEYKKQLEITTKMLHRPTRQVIGSRSTARLNEKIEMETPECHIRMMITEVPMEGGA